MSLAPVVVAAPRQRERTHLGLWFACALFVHSVVLGVGWLYQGSQPPRGLPDAARRAEIEVEIFERVEEQLGEPGGGSLNPDDSEPPEAGVEEPTNETRLAPTVSDPEAPTAELPAPPATWGEENDQESVSSELPGIPSDLGDFALPVDVRPRTARTSRIQQRLPSEPARGTATHNSRGQHLGYGPGANGGPGGAGKGWTRRRGKRDRRAASSVSPFGGTTGAWRGEICLLPHGTTSLKDVGSCPRAGELRTSVINVSARRFDQGFPGVTERYEYFAIKYTGEFTVKETGVYRFRVHADDGAILTIDGQRAIDNDGVHEPLSRTRFVYLPAGVHTFRLTYFQGPRYDIALQVFVKPTEGKEQLFRPVF